MAIGEAVAGHVEADDVRAVLDAVVAHDVHERPAVVVLVAVHEREDALDLPVGRREAGVEQPLPLRAVDRGLL